MNTSVAHVERNGAHSVVACTRQAGLTAISRLYVWSLILEPLLFFLLAANTATGVGANPGRVLQFLVLSGLALKWLSARRPLRIFNPLHPLYRSYTLYFAFTAMAAFVGFAMGSYTLESQYDSSYASSFVAEVIRSPAFRPFFEYFITVYYFVYFVVLPSYLLNSERAVRYFFRTFTFVFTLCVVVGVIELMLMPLGFAGIPRHLSDGVLVGFRFHGLAGEPRDAFVYMIFGLATLTLRDFHFKNKSLSKVWVVVIVAAALFTQSASGLFGLVFAGALILAFSLRYLSPRTLFLASALAAAMAVAVIVGVYFSPRIQLYLQALNTILEVFERGQRVPEVLSGQMPNIYPIWDIYRKIADGNFLQVVFGSGLGSASVVNNNLGHYNVLANPHTQIVRVLYESGLVGLYWLIMTFAQPVRYLTVNEPPAVRRKFLVLMLLLVGAFLSHRSAAPFIFLGIFIVTLRQRTGRVAATANDSGRGR